MAHTCCSSTPRLARYRPAIHEKVGDDRFHRAPFARAEKVLESTPSPRKGVAVVVAALVVAANPRRRPRRPRGQEAKLVVRIGR